MDAPPDLPAAHSMDTEWFAVDGHGRVGVFDSGEGGGVPNAHFDVWQSQSHWEMLLEELVRIPPPGGLRFDADGVFERDDRRDEYDRGDWVDSPGDLDFSRTWPAQMLVELEPAAARDPARLAAAFGPGHALTLACEPPLVYVTGRVVDVLASAWYELGVVQALVDIRLEPERFGLYRYDCDDYSGGPYQRRGSPSGPLRVEELPTALRSRLARVRFAAVDFARDRRIQPFEHAPSRIWGSTWIAMDGTIHSLE